MDCHIEIFIDGRWVTAAVFEPNPQTLDQGVGGGGQLQYDIDYAVAYLGNRAAEIIPGLTVGFENLAKHITFIELDHQIAAVWKTILYGDGEWLADRIVEFKFSHEARI